MKTKALVLFLLFFSQCCFAQHWDSLRGGLNRYVWSMFSDSVTDKLYVGGAYTFADGKDVRGMSTWSNENWDSLGPGIDRCSQCGNFPQKIWTINRYDSCIYIGGAFEAAGNVWTPAFARWNGSAWDSVPGGKIPLYNAVDDIVVDNNEMYISGTFDSVGNISAHHVAKWNGTTWTAIGPNYNFGWTASGSFITSMIFYHSNLYVAGIFDDAQGNVCRLAKWDGQNWQFFTNEIQGGLATIFDMEIYNDELYVGGLFYMADGCAGTGIMVWNDTIWKNVSGGSIEVTSNPNPEVHDMTVHNGILYCVGNFQRVGGVDANYLASWDGVSWCGYNTVYGSGSIGTIEFYHDTMYVGGSFLELDGDSANYIARWVGSGSDTCGNTTAVFDYQYPVSEVSIFPNPSTTSTTFQFSLSQSCTLVITDNLGREIFRRQTTESFLEFPASEYSSGMYFYRVEDENGNVSTGKFVVEH